MPSVDRPWGVFLCVLSFSGGALTDMLKRKLFGIGLAPSELGAGATAGQCLGKRGLPHAAHAHPPPPRPAASSLSAEIVLSWNCCDACILLVGSLLFDPLPLQTLADLGPSFWKPLLGSATLCVIGSVLHATAIKKVRGARRRGRRSRPPRVVLCSPCAPRRRARRTGRPVVGALPLVQPGLLAAHLLARQRRDARRAGHRRRGRAHGGCAGPLV